MIDSNQCAPKSALAIIAAAHNIPCLIVEYFIEMLFITIEFPPLVSNRVCVTKNAKITGI
jgi:hypothetical protein